MNKKYLPSALILYLNYFIHGVGCSILGQAVIKEALATAWGVEAMAITAISAALGLGRLIALPFAGPLSDKLGRLMYVQSSVVSQTPSLIQVSTRQFPRSSTKLLALLQWESNSSSLSLR